MPGKGRAMGYSDYYKNNSQTPGGSYDDEEDGRTLGISITFGNRGIKPKKNSTPDEEARKKALKRRLSRMRKSDGTA